MLKQKCDSSIRNLNTIHLHHLISLNSEIYSYIQLENSLLIIIGLGNGTINYFHKEDLFNPFFILHLDNQPITNIAPISNNLIACSSSKPAIYIVGEHPQNQGEYEIKNKINIKNTSVQINKIVSLENSKILTIDNCFLSLWSSNFDIIKEKKINSPIVDLVLLKKKNFVCALPLKQSLTFFEHEKLSETYNIKDIKFISCVDFNNILCLFSDEDLLFVGGCLGSIYLVNLKYKEFIANIKLENLKGIVTSVYQLVNGDFVCGVSQVFADEQGENVKVCSDMVQYQFKSLSNSFKEISRKNEIHSNIIRVIIEILNHKEMKEIITASLDGNIKVWN